MNPNLKREFEKNLKQILGSLFFNLDLEADMADDGYALMERENPRQCLNQIWEGAGRKGLLMYASSTSTHVRHTTGKNS